MPYFLDKSRLKLLLAGMMLLATAFFASEPIVEVVLGLLGGCHAEPEHIALPPQTPPDSTSQPPKDACMPEKRCSEMASCAEAYFHYHTCGHTWHDGNRNGVPCEVLCKDGYKKMH